MSQDQRPDGGVEWDREHANVSGNHDQGLDPSQVDPSTVDQSEVGQSEDLNPDGDLSGADLPGPDRPEPAPSDIDRSDVDHSEVEPPDSAHSDSAHSDSGQPGEALPDDHHQTAPVRGGSYSPDADSQQIAGRFDDPSDADDSDPSQPDPVEDAVDPSGIEQGELDFTDPDVSSDPPEADAGQAVSDDAGHSKSVAQETQPASDSEGPIGEEVPPLNGTREDVASEDGALEDGAPAGAAAEGAPAVGATPEDAAPVDFEHSESTTEGPIDEGPMDAGQTAAGPLYPGPGDPDASTVGADELGPEWFEDPERFDDSEQTSTIDPVAGNGQRDGVEATAVDAVPPVAAFPPGLFDESDADQSAAAQAPTAAGAARASGPARAGIGQQSAATASPKKRRRGRRVLIGLLVAVGALYLAGYVFTGGRLPANATIGGIDVGSQSPEEARRTLDRELSPRVDDPIQLVSGPKGKEQEFEIPAAEAGLEFDLDRSVEVAGGTRSWDPRVMISNVFGDHDYAPALNVNQTDLDSVIDTIGDTVEVPVVEALITFPKSKPKARQPKEGLEVDRKATDELIRSSYLVQTKPAEVPTQSVQPTVDSEGLDAAMDSIAEPAVSAPVKLEVGKKDRLDLPVAVYTPALTVVAKDKAMVAKIDSKKLAKPLAAATTSIGEPAVDASIDIVGGSPKITRGKNGVGVQPKEMADKLTGVLTESGDARKVRVKASVVEPELTTKEAKKLGVKEQISSFETNFPHARYRNVNQSRAAELLDGTLIKPGETFSFNDTIGERSEANGFTSGAVINGGQFRDELGGGVSQVVTTTYNAAFFAGLDDVEHHPHAFYIDRYPVGREATVYYGSLDLRFKNSTKYGVLIKASVRKSSPGGQGTTRVEMWSTKVWDIKAGKSPRRNARQPGTRYDESDRCVPQAPIPGFDIDIYRTFRKDGKKVKTETVTANYQAADRVICGPRPGKKKGR